MIFPARISSCAGRESLLGGWLSPVFPVSEGPVMSDPADLKHRLPAGLAARVQSLRLADGVATVILDGSGLDGGARDAAEKTVKDALTGAPDVSEVRVGIMADRPAEPPKPKGPLIISVGAGKGAWASRPSRPIWRWHWRARG
jgi:ATP-binding protein involved in chromosome partitioning